MMQKILDIQRSLQTEASFLSLAEIATPLGTMVAIADERFLYLLEFSDRLNLLSEIKRLNCIMQSKIVPGWNLPLCLIQQELEKYFQGKLFCFSTPIKMQGSPFQIRVWEELQKIPVRETRSYKELAHLLEKPHAYRAVAQANRSNQLAIILPCHRVIYQDGSLGGYAGGINRKEWLLAHEKSI